MYVVDSCDGVTLKMTSIRGRGWPAIPPFFLISGSPKKLFTVKITSLLLYRDRVCWATVFFLLILWILHMNFFFHVICGVWVIFVFCWFLWWYCYENDFLCSWRGIEYVETLHFLLILWMLDESLVLVCLYDMWVLLKFFICWSLWWYYCQNDPFWHFLVHFFWGWICLSFFAYVNLVI